MPRTPSVVAMLVLTLLISRPAPGGLGRRPARQRDCGQRDQRADPRQHVVGPGRPGPPAAVARGGGKFTSIEGVAANHIAMRDPATGQWHPMAAGLGNLVQSLTVYNGDVIAGGNFGGKIARWNGAGFETLWWRNERGGALSHRL